MNVKVILYQNTVELLTKDHPKKAIIIEGGLVSHQLLILYTTRINNFQGDISPLNVKDVIASWDGWMACCSFLAATYPPANHH